MQIKIFNHFNLELEKLWKEFETKANSYPFQSYDWLLYWHEHLDQIEYDLKIHVFVFFLKKKVRAIFPLSIRKTWNIKVLEFLGGEINDFNSPLIAKSMKLTEFKKIWNELKNILPNHDIVYFKNIPELVENNENFLLKNIKAKIVNKSFYTILPNNVDDYFSTISKKMLKDNSRMLRRLNERGKLKFQIINDYKDFTNTLTKMIDQKIIRYNLTGNRNIFLSKSILNFYKNLFNLYKKNFNIHLSTLTLEEETLAINLGVIYKNQFYYLFPTFNNDKKWNKFSLGRIHLEKLIRWTIYNKINKLDFTIGTENYKSLWCENNINIYKYLKVTSIKGYIFYMKEIIIELIKSNNTLKKLAISIFDMIHKKHNY